LNIQEPAGAVGPFDQARCPGETAIFSTTPQGTGPFTFVWRKGDALLSGQANSVLSLANVSSADAGVYSVEVTGACGTATNSATLSIRVPATAIGPIDQTRCVGEAAVFSTSPQGTGPFSFVWRKDGSLLAAQTANTLTLANVTAADAGVYSVEVTGACGTVTKSATLSIRVPVTATGPLDQTHCPGATAIFATIPQGTGPFSFVWRKDGSLLAAQTSSALNRSSVSSADAGIYSVEVTGACGTVTNAATLSIRVPVTVTGPINQTRCPGATAIFSLTTQGTGPLTYVWRKDGSLLAAQTSSVLTLSNVSGASAGVYSVEVTGACGAVTNAAILDVKIPTTVTGPINQTRCLGETAIFSTTPQGTGPFTYVWRKGSSLLPGQNSSVLTLFNVSDASAGLYSVEVTGACGTMTNAATLSIRAPVTATGPSGQTRCPGATAVFSTTPQGTGPFTYVWRKNGSLLATQTNSVLSVFNVTSADAGVYSVEVRGACGAVTNVATLSLSVPTMTSDLVDQIPCAGGVATFETIPQGTGPFTFGWRKDGALLPGQTNSVLVLSNVSSADAGLYFVEVRGPCDTITKFATLIMRTQTAAFGPYDQTRCLGETAVFNTTPTGTGPFSFLWRKDGLLLAGQTGNTLSLPNVSSAHSGTYSVEVIGGCSAVTNVATLSIMAPTTATVPIDQTPCAGEPAVFETIPQGTGPFGFVWRKDGTLLPDQAGNVLLISNVSSADAGVYSVEVTGACGTVTNRSVLSIATDISATPLTDQIRCTGESATFTTIAGGTAPFSYVWRKDGAVISGQNNSSLTLSNLAAYDAGVYSVAVIGSCGAVTNSATLQMNPPPVVSGLTNLFLCPGQTAIFGPNVISSVACNYYWRRNGSLLNGETNMTLVVAAVDAAKAGTYSLEVHSSCGIFSSNVTLALKTNVSVGPLNDQARCAGQSVTWTAMPSGTGPFSFVWKKEGTVIPNATNVSFTVASVAAASAGVYSVDVIGACGTASATARLMVNAALLQDTTVCAGELVKLGTAASGVFPAAFVWRKDGNIISSQTNATLTISNATVSDSGIYSVALNDCGQATNTARLTVRALLNATMPTNIVACTCSDLTLAPTISGTGPFNCVWKKNGTVLSGETNAALNLGKLNIASPGVFTIEITGPCNSATNSTTLSVIETTLKKWTNANPVVIPEFGNAAPYPSPIFVQCTPGPISELRVTLFGLSHTFPDDLDIVLVGPDGTALKLMSDSGGGTGNFLSDVDLVFDDSAAGYLPDLTAIAAGSYWPSDYNGSDDDFFSAPAPASSTTGPLARFFGKDPNGYWSLFVVDDHGRDAGALKGWSLDFGRRAFVFDDVWLDQPRKLADGSFTMRVNGTPNKTYYIEASTDFQHWNIVQTNKLTSVTANAVDTTAAQFNYRFYRVSGCRN